MDLISAFKADTREAGSVWDICPTLFAFCIICTKYTIARINGDSLKNTVSLKLNKDFRRLYSRGKHFAGGYVVVYAMKNRLEINRLGLTAGKSVGNAVKRNRVKRLIRESYRAVEDKLSTGYDFVIVARGRMVGKTLKEVSKDMNYVLKKMELL